MAAADRAISPERASGFALLSFFLLAVLATDLGFADLGAAATERGQPSLLERAFTVATTLFVVTAMMAPAIIWSPAAPGGSG